MILKTIIISVILVAIVMLALGVKLLFDKKATFTAHSHSCALDDGELSEDGVCMKCELKSKNHGYLH